MTTAARFDEAGDRVTCSQAPPDPAVALTIALWVYLAVDRNDFSTFIRLHGGAVPGSVTVTNLATDGSGQTPSIFTVGGTVAGPEAIAVGQWSRVALTVVGGTAGTIYVGGAAGAVGSASGTVGAATAPTGLTLGGRSASDASEWANVRMANVRIWAAQLDLEALEAEWESGNPVTSGNLWADYRLSDADDLDDHSGNGHHLAPGATALTTEEGPPITEALDGMLGRIAGPSASSGLIAGPTARSLLGAVT